MFRHVMFLFQLLCMNTKLVHSPDTIVNDSFPEKGNLWKTFVFCNVFVGEMPFEWIDMYFVELYNGTSWTIMTQKRHIKSSIMGLNGQTQASNRSHETLLTRFRKSLT